MKFSPSLLFLPLLLILCLNAPKVKAQKLDYSKKDSLLGVVFVAKKDTGTSRAWVILGRMYRRTDADSARLCFDKALRLSRQLNDRKGEADALGKIAYLLEKTGDYPAALDSAEKWKAAATFIRDSVMLASATQEVATIQSHLGNMPAAQQGFLQFLKISEAIHHQQFEGMALVCLGNFYYESQQFDDATGFYNRALAIQKSQNDSLMMASTFINLSSCYFEAKKPDLTKAIASNDQALAYLQGFDNTEELSFYAYLREGEYQAAAANFPRANKGILQAEAIALAQSSDYKLAQVRTIQSVIAEAEGRIPQAVAYLNEAYALSQKMSDLVVEKNTAAGLAELYERTGNWKEAYSWNETYHALSDSIEGQAVKDRVNELNISYQSEKKDRELAQQQLTLTQNESRIRLLLGGASALGVSLLGLLLIMVQRRKINRQTILQLEQEKEVSGLKAMMAGEEKERTRIAKELHDGLGGLLSAAKLQLSVLSTRQPELADTPGFAQGLSLIDTASNEARKIAHNLMPEMLTRLGLPEALRAFCAQMSTAGVMVLHFEYFGPETRLPATLELSVYRIVQELINNVIKHAGATEADVQLVRDESVLAITVEDNGQGFAADTTQSGIGLDAIQSRLNFLNGKMDVQSTPGKGASVFIEIMLRR